MFTEQKLTILLFIGIVFFIFAILGTTIVVVVYKYQKKHLAYLKNMNQLKERFENTLYKSQVEIQEQTFQHISKEIHDNISQKLTLVKLYLNTMKVPEEDQAAVNLHSSIAVLTQTIADLRSISSKLNSDFILENGLAKVIEWEVEKITKTGLFDVHYQIIGKEQFLNPQTELILFRIFQESINNCIKHSEAVKINIVLNYETDFLKMKISDNGKGFNTAQPSNGSGLKNIEQRTKLLKGKFNINATEKGTEIKIEVPIGEDV